ncbi:MAG: SpoIIE family protein phosphatase [Ignavibacteriales bacterium]|nr:SpoIIE family protein phosphatase [Ignavibacteriales bacterium]
MNREHIPKSSSKGHTPSARTARSLTSEKRGASDVLALFEFSNVVNSSVDLKFILGTVLLTVMGKMLVAKGMVLLKKDPGEFEVVNAKGLGQETVGQMVCIEGPIRGIDYTDRAGASKSWAAFFRERGQKLLVPILSQRRVVGLLSLGERLGGKRYSKAEHQLINSLVNLSAAAIEKAVMIEQLRDVNRSLDRKYQELNTLFDLSKEFNVILDAEKVIRLLTFSLLGQVGVNRYAFCLEDNGKLKIMASKLDQELGSPETLKQLCSLKGADLVENLFRQKRFAAAAEQLQRVGIVAVIPMHIQNQVKGAVLLGEKLRGGQYAKADLEFLYSLANLAIISIENARLFRDAIEKQRLEDELAIAREIQQGLLPASIPKIPGFEVSAVNITSLQVGGDYYDVVPIHWEEFILAIGDVSGKGTPAALLMANVQASLRAFAPMGMSLPAATARINDLTCANTGQDKFITFFWGSLYTKTREFRYVNAGHNPPFLLKADGSVQRLDIGGIILGLMKTMTPYQEGSVSLSSGDVIVMFTDGVSEAMNGQEEDFTEERLEQVLRKVRTQSPARIIAEIQTALEAHTQDTPQSDDITMLVLKAI